MPDPWRSPPPRFAAALFAVPTSTLVACGPVDATPTAGGRLVTGFPSYFFQPQAVLGLQGSTADA